MAAGTQEGGARRFLVRLKHVRRRTWVIAGAVAALVICGATTAGVLLFRPDSAQAAPVTQAVAASLETLEKTVETSGTLTPTVQEAVSFAASGTVKSVAVVAGDTVEAGQLLATVDTLRVNAELLQAQADLADAQASLVSEQSSADGTAASSARIAARQAAVTVAEQTVASAEAALAGATLTAPVAGLVTEVNVQVGDAVTGTSGSGSSGSGSAGGSGQSMGGGSTSSSATSSSSSQFIIVGTDSWSVSVTLGETEIGLVEAGDQVELATDDGTQLFGIVTEVGLLPSTTSGSVAYPVSIGITGSTEGLFDGTGATVTIIYERRSEVLAVPSSAVTTGSDGTTTVTVVDDSGAESVREVVVGESSGDLTEITDGLAEGELVLVTVFTPGEGNSGESGTDRMSGGMPDFSGGMPDFGSGEMPDFSQMQGGNMQGGFPGGQQ